jgi:hypothetical protein
MIELSVTATDRVDQYGRLLRYVIRAGDGLNVNVRLVAGKRRRVGEHLVQTLPGARAAGERGLTIYVMSSWIDSSPSVGLSSGPLDKCVLRGVGTGPRDL